MKKPRDFIMNVLGFMFIPLVVASCRTQPVVEQTIHRPLTFKVVSESATRLAGKMLASKRLQENYGEISKNGKPTIVVGFIENKTNLRIVRELDTAGDQIRIALQDSGKFEAKDDRANPLITHRILENIDGGLEDGTLREIFGSQRPPDVFLSGVFKQYESDPHTVSLYLAVYNLRSGKIVWDDIDIISL